MTDMNPESQELVDLARDGDDPSDEDRRRVRRALAMSLAAGAAATTTTQLAHAGKGALAAGAAGTTATATGKIAAWVAVGALAGVGATSTALFIASTVHEQKNDARPAVAEMAQPTSVAVVRGETPRVEERTAASEETTREPEAAPAAAKAAEPTTNTPRAAKPAASSLAEETALLSEARAALGRGDAETALAILATHERTYATGALREERLAARVFALCALGRRAEAAATAATLLRESPGSPQRARVLDSCAYHP